MSLVVGAIVEGVVTGITHFGAFVQLANGETGLVHISEVADSYVKDINEHLQKKDKVQVKVLSVDGNGKIGLSIKQVKSGGGGRGRGSQSKASRLSFEDKLNKFMKDSDERLQDLRRSTESKRGGKGSPFRVNL
ncbi:S1 RNA-binding domain-containing protein [Dethiobacter alkaliphilus]|uniref:RNA binding S1 domain protein n=1 Tax=Dethiobacter alkaliphilus AHT 1 TaxID=555088 RepID=C0GJ00_DETAL|nr:S1 RNA-binding domain-containing protein [Dethiobacter alkaliphilus]EEG76633.1 RNA binding S1 domain protein [Dethiobacter alkaliphilus AHT 1]MCW3489138.1 S1 RNA-binding domain-containing protein [Dethiobacter alkaliphilus]